MNLPARKIDRRVTKTKAAIRKAFIRLLGQKDLNEITVTDVALTADVDRKTVYNYYDGVAAIQSELEDELVGLVGRSIRESDVESSVREPLTLLEAVHRVFSEYRELAAPFVRESAHSQMLQKLGNAISDRVSAMIRSRLKPAEQEYSRMYADFLASGILSVYRDWFVAGMQQPLEEVAKQISLFLSGGIAAFTEI